MYILQNAAKNLLRNRGRNALIASIFLVLLAAASVALIINSTTKGVIADYTSRFGSEVTIDADYEKLMQAANSGSGGGVTVPDIPEITYEQSQSFAKSEYIKDAAFTGWYGGKTDDTIKAVGEDEENNNQNNQSGMGGMTYDTSGGNVTLQGYDNKNQMTAFNSGKRKITSGRLFEKDNEAIVSEAFAKLNKLKIGDTLRIYDIDKKAKASMELKVVGIYFDGVSLDNKRDTPFDRPLPPIADPSNEILTNLATLATHREALKKTDEKLASNVQVSAKYTLKNPDMLDAFTKEVKGKGLPDSYAVSTNKEAYDAIVKPVQGISQVTTTFLVLVLLVGGVLLIIVTNLAIHERRYEIGVLRAIGLKKWGVARGLLYETLIIIAVTLTLGIAIANVVAQPVASSLLASQASQPKTNSSIGGGGVVMTSLDDTQSDVEPLSEITTTLSREAILQITGIALLLGIVASGVAIAYIVRYEPTKILAERS